MTTEERRLRFQRVAALSLAAIVMLIPANLLPVMFVFQAGAPPVDATIMGGIRLLAADGFLGLAAIVFIASVVVPFLKLAGLAVLWWAARRSDRMDPARMTRLHAALDFIGRWSMLDVFLVAFLGGAVQFGVLATVEPRPGIVAFAVAVVLTMIATRAFNPRMLCHPEGRLVEPTRQPAP